MANCLDNLELIDSSGNITNVLINSSNLLNVASVEHSDLGVTFSSYENDYDGFIIPSGSYNMKTSYTASKAIVIIGLNNPIINCSSNVQITMPYRSYIEGIDIRFVSGGHITTQQYPPIETTASGTIIRNVSVRHGNGGIAVNNAQDVLIDNCSVTYSRSEIIAGIWVGGLSQETKIINCTCSNNVLDGIHIASDGITIDNCICSENGAEPITLTGALGACGIYGLESTSRSFIIIRNCKTEYNSECGIDCNFYFTDIQGCQATQNGLSGIAIRNTYNSKIINNTCLNNGNNPTTLNPDLWGHSGIDITSGNGLIVTNNICTDSRSTRKQQYGINVINGTAIATMVTNNMCNYNTNAGVRNITDGVNDCIVKNNMILQ